MRRGWANGFPRSALVVVGIAVAATGMLIAQDAERTTDANSTREQPTTQPSAAAQPDPVPADAARQRLLSGLISSKHDFSGAGEDGRALCLPCHAPHRVDAEAPRLDQRAQTAQPLTPYRARDVELDGWSLLCLGCHDGVTAVGVYSTGHAITIAGQLGNSRLGTSGLRSHPVGNKYPEGRPDYQPRAAVEAAGLLMPGGHIQCGTCHDAHNTYGYTGMLKISNERSRLCLTCHRL